MAHLYVKRHIDASECGFPPNSVPPPNFQLSWRKCGASKVGQTDAKTDHCIPGMNVAVNANFEPCRIAREGA